MRYEGAKRVRVGKEGDLLVETELSVLTESKPVAYQVIDGERVEVAASFKVARDGSVGFEVGRYDALEPLVIDPVFGFSTYGGGGGADQAFGLAVDATGVYVTGQTNSVGFPVSNTFGTRADQDTFALKLSPDGSTLIYSAILAGSGSDLGFSTQVHPTDQTLYVLGTTDSANFPTTAGAFDTTFNGGIDYTVTQLNTAFTSCLRQDGDPTVLLFNTLTGQYQLCAPLGINFAGTATISTSGCTITLSDPNTFIQINVCNRSGYASVFVPGKAFVILVDQNIDDNVCVCAP
jgi:hypothetical protein